jgi:dipeptidyl peptidase-like protein
MCSSSARATGQIFLKGSSAISARATEAPRRTGRSSARRRPTPTSAEAFALAGPSEHPDPNFNAYRKDLADVALAGRVIASHYAEAVERQIASPTPLRIGPSNDAEIVRELAQGQAFDMLDDSLGWAWGYAGADRRVGYVQLSAVAAV